MYTKIPSMLDKIADSLESKGFIKEAYDLDVISNTLEKGAGLSSTIKSTADSILSKLKFKPTLQEAKDIINKKFNIDGDPNRFKEYLEGALSMLDYRTDRSLRKKEAGIMDPKILAAFLVIISSTGITEANNLRNFLRSRFGPDTTIESVGKGELPPEYRNRFPEWVARTGEMPSFIKKYEEEKSNEDIGLIKVGDKQYLVSKVLLVESNPGHNLEFTTGRNLLLSAISMASSINDIKVRRNNDPGSNCYVGVDKNGKVAVYTYAEIYR